jgi:hypothetical protein
MTNTVLMLGLCTLFAMIAGSSLASGMDNESIVQRFNFPGEENAAEWQLGADVTIKTDSNIGGDRYIHCGASDPAASPYAILKGIKVKPNTGYIARCRIKSVLGNSQFTFAVLKPASGKYDRSGLYDEYIERIAENLFTQDVGFYVCRDDFLCGAPGWEELKLPFRTQADQTEIGLYVARRYGAEPILFDDIELIEDDSVLVGEIVPTPNPVPVVKPEEQSRGYLISRQHWMQPVFPGYLPTRGEITDTVDCWLSPGEYEPATFSITGLRALENVSVHLAGDLKSIDEAVLSAEHVKIGTVRCITRWLTNSSPISPGQRFEKRPLFIFPNAPVRVESHKTATWWLTVYAPESQPAGVYEGQILINADGAPEHAINLKVEVLPIKLADPEVTYGMYYRHTEQPAELKNEAMFMQAAHDMKAHGMNSASIYTQVERMQPDGTWVVDLNNEANGFYSLNRQMEMLTEAGLAQPGHPILFLPSHGGSDGLSDNALALPALANQLTRKGWPELLLYLYDEVGAKKELWEALDKEMKQIAEIRNQHPDVASIRLTTAAPGEKSHYYDVIIRGDKIPGKEMWTYNCSWNGSQPMNDRFFAGLHTWSEELLGNWQWCYTESRQLKLTDTGELDLGKIGAYADPWSVNYVMPSPEGNIPTMGWEGRREGVDDYRYLQTLREAIAKAEQSSNANKKELAREARAFLNSVKEQAKVPPPKETPSQINSSRPYSVLMHPGLTYEFYDDVRLTIARWILRLQT